MPVCSNTMWAILLVVASLHVHWTTSECPFAQRHDVDDTHTLQTRQASCPYTQVTCDPKAPYRTLDGSCNNLVTNTIWGKAGIPQKRLIPNRYQDGHSSPTTLAKGGNDLPWARVASTKINQDDRFADFQSHRFTHMLMQWGQLIDHDITYTPQMKESDGSEPICCQEDLPSGSKLTQADLNAKPECFIMPITHHDRHFRRACMNFVRSVQTTPLNCSTGHKEQLNSITAFIDGSQVYGSSAARLARVRNGTTPFLSVSDNNLLPHQMEGEHCMKDHAGDYCYLAGDVRVNVQPALMSLQTIFMREHNRIAAHFAQKTSWNNDKIFYETRKIIGAILQHITYNQWLNVIFGSEYSKYDLQSTSSGFSPNVYDPAVDPSIANEFSAAAYRFGHSLVNSRLTRQFGSFNESTLLRYMYGRPKYIAEDGGQGLNRIINGLLIDFPEKGDRWYSVEITDHLFENGSYALDLAAINAQRGRDHGLATYNDVREYCGRARATSFSTSVNGGLSDHHDVPAHRLQNTYSHTDDIDFYQGGISEASVSGADLGPTFLCIIGKQFERLKHGDRFWYEREDSTTGFTSAQVGAIKKVSLSRLICDNTDITSLQRDAFHQPTGTHRNPIFDCSDTFHIPTLELGFWTGSLSHIVG